MTDIILGMGEVGETLFDLLVDRKFDCVGIDLDNTKCKKYSENEVIKIQNIFMYACQEN
jgi:TrkA-N domain.